MEQAVLPKILAQDRKGSTWCGIRLEKIFIESEKEKKPHIYLCKERGKSIFQQPKESRKKKRKENLEDNWKLLLYLEIC